VNKKEKRAAGEFKAAEWERKKVGGGGKGKPMKIEVKLLGFPSNYSGKPNSLSCFSG
jgi:hypothetical protein